jgi:hypothetical protein
MSVFTVIGKLGRVRFRTMLVPLLTSLLGACLSATAYHSPTASEARMYRDLNACERAALKDAPVAEETSKTPG